MGNETVVSHFEHQVEVYPQRVAVTHRDQTLTYDALNRMANRVARAIVSQCGDGEEAAALLFDKNIAAVGAMLGALKAGKFLVALDISDPPGRSLLIQQDVGAGLLLTDRAHLERARSLARPGCVVISLDDVAADLDDSNLGLDFTADRLMSMIYTSGSTGTPKGIPRTQRTLLASSRSRNERGLNNSGDRLAMFYSLSVATAETIVFGALMNAGACCLYDIHSGGFGGLADWLRREHITVYQSTTTVFRHFAAQLDGPLDLPSLRMVALNGEAVLKHDFELFKKFFKPPCRMRVIYSSSEARGVTEFLLDHQTAVTGSVVPNGRPVGTVQVLIRDEAGRDLDIGQAGEIVVRSNKLAEGYWRKPALTAERFIPDPAGDGQRLYRTGDLGRLRPDGMLEHLGRIDEQIKVRGRRVELGEVDAALLDLEFVQQAAVVERADAQGDNQLIAYLVTAGIELPSAAMLRERLRARLPEYMLPAAFVPIEAFPLTVSGKIDRRALPEYVAPAPLPAVAAQPVAARDDLEACLTGIWRDLLRVPSVGADDNFFDLGGHSLLAAELCRRIDQHWERRLAPSDIALAPTVRQLVRLLREQPPPSGSPLLVPLQRGESGSAFFCVHGFGGGVLGYVPLARALGVSQPFYGLQARGIDMASEPHRTIPEMAAAYVRTVREVQPHGPYQLGGYCYGGVVAYEMACQLQAQGEPVSLLAVFEGYAPALARTRASFWNPRHVVNFGRNVPYWFRDYTRLGSRLMVARAARRGRRAWRRLAGPFARSAQPALADLVDDPAGIPAGMVHLLQVHLGALHRYTPQVYAGEVTLFRVRGLSLLRAHDPTMGWSSLASGGLQLKLIGGAHYNILDEPHVQSLAGALGACLRAAG